MTRVAIAQLGARWHYTVPRTLETLGALQVMFTDITVLRGWPRALATLPRALQPAWARRLKGRVPLQVPPGRVRDFPAFGARYAWRRSRSRSQREMLETHLWAGKEFCRLVLAHGLEGARVFYGLNTASLEVLAALRGSGTKRILEQTIAPFEIERRILAGEERIHARWAKPEASSEAADETAERERAEWRDAEIIVCASEFVRDGIAACGGPVERCRIIPYAMEVPPLPVARPARGGPIRVLTVGGLGLRKGTHHLLEAAKALEGACEFRLVGPLDGPREALASRGANVTWTGAVPRAEVARHYEWAEVFVLPSLCEGSALVTYEALAMGLPVVCTANTGSVVEEGVSGHIVAAGNVGELVHTLGALTRARLAEMGENARRRALLFTPERYAARLGSLLREIDPEAR